MFSRQCFTVAISMVVLGASAEQGNTATVVADFNGVLRSVLGDPPPGDFTTGQSVSGTIRYDTEEVETLPGDTETFARYAFPVTPNSEISLTFGEYTWASSGSVIASVANGTTNDIQDQITFHAGYVSNSNYRPESFGLPESSISEDTGAGSDTVFELRLQAGSTSIDLINGIQLPASVDDVNEDETGEETEYFTGSVSAFDANGRQYRLNFDFNSPNAIFGESPEPEPEPETPVIPETEVTRIVHTLDPPGLGSTTGSFQFSVEERTLTYAIDVGLTGAGVDAAYERVEDFDGSYIDYWERGIESIWNNGIDTVLVDGIEYYFDFDVEFSREATGSENYFVEVLDAAGRGSRDQWYLDLGGIGLGQARHGVFAAHEFGHMLGLYDEYLELTDPGSGFLVTESDFVGFVDPTVPYASNCFFLEGGRNGEKAGDFCNSLMADLGPVQERYYRRLVELVGVAPDANLAFAMAPPGFFEFVSPDENYLLSEAHDHIATVPVPSSILFLLGGICGLTVAGKRRRTSATQIEFERARGGIWQPLRKS